jgi:hypothetical protein
MEGATWKTLWAIIILCCESLLTAVPTITIFSEPQSAGLHLEGIALDSLGTLRPIAVDRLAEPPILGVPESPRHADLVGKGRTTVVPEYPFGASSFSPRHDLDYITCSTTRAIWMPVNCRFASGISWSETAPFRHEHALWLSRRY